MTGRPNRGWSDLDPAIEVHDSVDDLDALWDRFEIFEAMHHSQRICNPMTEAEVSELVDAMAFEPHQRVLDVACGPGEVLIRAHRTGVTDSLGIDLSPWMLQSAVRRARADLADVPRPRWLLADGSKADVGSYDAVVCLGAEWIWHGMVGTIAALTERVVPGGVVAYGGPRLDFSADPSTATELFGALDTADDVEMRLRECGLEPRLRIDPGQAGWYAYLERGRRDVTEWAATHPSDRADRWVAEQQEWTDRFEQDRAIVGWSVWIADRPL